jgi:DNA-binding response OmpR family regulator
MGSRILVVDDDKKTVDIIKIYLEKNRYRVFTAYNGLQALQIAQREQPNLIILDLMLPKVDGMDVCYKLRDKSDVPIIMLTARTTEADKLMGLEMGADDYVTKPFSPRELVARVKAVLRRSQSQDAYPVEEIQCNDLLIDFVRHEVRRRNVIVHLTPREFKLLGTLARQPGRTFSRMQLLERAFGFDYDGLERTIDVHIKNLRKKIEPDPTNPTYVQTVYGIGYKFIEQ